LGSRRPNGKVVLHKLDRDSLFVELPHDPTLVIDVAGEPIKSMDGQRVAFADTTVGRLYGKVPQLGIYQHYRSANVIGGIGADQNPTHSGGFLFGDCRRQLRVNIHLV
jgi:hypothetical protein